MRRLIGYQRLDTPLQQAWLDDLYSNHLRPYNSAFQPVMKLVAKEQVGERTIKRHDIPKTPLRRLLDSGAADPKKVDALVALYTQVSPLTLKRQIDRKLAAMPAHLEVQQSA